MSNDQPPKSRGEQLAEKLAGSNPVEPKAVAEATPAPSEKEAAEAKAEAKPEPKKAEAKKPEPKPEPKKEKPKDPTSEIPEPPPWYRTLRADPPAHIRLALGLAMVGLIFGLWWVVTHGGATDAIISPSKLPSPGATLGKTGELAQRDLTDSIIDSVQRVLLGIGLAAIVGVSLGVLAGAHRGLSAVLAPIVIFLRSVPMGAMLPLTVLAFGDGDKQKWMFIFLAVVPFVFSDTMKAISSVPDRYVETAQTLGASKRQIIMKVLVPLSLPDVITSLRFQFGLALGYIVLAEAGSTYVAHGLGKMLEISAKRGLIEHIYLLLFIITILAFLIDFLLRTLQRGVFPWRRDL